ncbi:MAG: hypothetical protein IKL55_07105 [Clostridia bacterium]|nr:hypothetical protein [Clostridia bacterium]
MEEIVQQKRNGSVRLEKVTDCDAVIFRATKVVDHIGFKFDCDGYIATIGENGTINCEENTREYCKIDKLLETRVTKLDFIVHLITITLAFIYLLLADGSVVKGVFHLLFEFSFALCLIPKAVAIWVYRLMGDKEFKSYSQFLEASNSAQNAFYALGRVPTVEEAKCYSPYEIQNKYLPKLHWPTTILALGFVNNVYGWNFLIVCLLIFVTTYILNKKNLLYFWQRILVAKPDDVHYEAAIAAISNAVKWTEKVEIKCTTIIVPTCFGFEEFPETKCLACDEIERCRNIKEMWNISKGNFTETAE